MSVDEDGERPLDPEVERLRARMTRLLGVSIGIMMIGLLAVLGAVVYKVTGSGSEPAAETAVVPGSPEGRLPLPAGARIEGASLSGNRILAVLRLADGRQQLVVYDLGSNGVVATIAAE